MDDKSSTLNSKKVWVVAARPANIVAIELLARIVEIYQNNFSDGNLDKKLLKQVRSSAEFIDFATATAELQKVHNNYSYRLAQNDVLYFLHFAGCPDFAGFNPEIHPD